MTKLLSLPLSERLDSLRQDRPRDPSGSAHVARQVLTGLGMHLQELVAGRPNVRGHSGFVFRWGEGWFEEFRDGGPGWFFQRDDKAAIDLRTNMLLDIYRPRQRSGLPALMNLLQESLLDGPFAPI